MIIINMQICMRCVDVNVMLLASSSSDISLTLTLSQCHTQDCVGVLHERFLNLVSIVIAQAEFWHQSILTSVLDSIQGTASFLSLTERQDNCSRFLSEAFCSFCQESQIP